MLFAHHKAIEYCPNCNGKLQIKQGKYGKFLSCVNYPTCEYIKPLHSHNLQVIKTLTELCPQCGESLQLKQGRFGIFIGCSHYPDCEFIMQTNQGENELKAEDYPCPNCKNNGEQGHLVSRHGRSGKLFYGCSNYPQCKFTITKLPQLKICPQCGCEIAQPFGKNHSLSQWECLNPQCQHIFSNE